MTHIILAITTDIKLIKTMATSFSLLSNIL